MILAVYYSPIRIALIFFTTCMPLFMYAAPMPCVAMQDQTITKRLSVMYLQATLMICNRRSTQPEEDSKYTYTIRLVIFFETIQRFEQSDIGNERRLEDSYHA